VECRGLDNPPEFLAVTAEGIRANGQQELVGFDKVAATYWKTALECGAREALLLTQEIKQRRQRSTRPARGGSIFDVFIALPSNGSCHTWRELEAVGQTRSVYYSFLYERNSKGFLIFLSVAVSSVRDLNRNLLCQICSLPLLT
jgi:hypothetical protein